MLTVVCCDRKLTIVIQLSDEVREHLQVNLGDKVCLRKCLTLRKAKSVLVEVDSAATGNVTKQVLQNTREQLCMELLKTY